MAYYFNAFEEATGIKVNALRLSAGEMLTRVAAEKDNPQASLMFGGSTDNYIAASSQGLLEAYQSPSCPTPRRTIWTRRRVEPHLCGRHRLRLQQGLDSRIKGL